jgi:hypothetical protein
MKHLEIQELSAPDQRVSLVQTTVVSVGPYKIKNGSLARVATSCLVTPSVGDSVLCAHAENDTQATILAVLVRLQPELPLIIAPEAALELQVNEITLVTGQAHLVASKVNVSIEVLKRVVNRIDEVVDYASSTFGSLFVRAKRSIKRVQELDEVQAGHIKIESPTLIEVHGSVTAISAEHLIQMQSKQIHMG